MTITIGFTGARTGLTNEQKNNIYWTCINNFCYSVWREKYGKKTARAEYTSIHDRFIKDWEKLQLRNE